MIVRDQSLLWHVIDSPFSRFSEFDSCDQDRRLIFSG